MGLIKYLSGTQLQQATWTALLVWIWWRSTEYQWKSSYTIPSSLYVIWKLVLVTIIKVKIYVLLTVKDPTQWLIDTQLWYRSPCKEWDLLIKLLYSKFSQQQTSHENNGHHVYIGSLTDRTNTNIPSQLESVKNSLAVVAMLHNVNSMECIFLWRGWWVHGGIYTGHQGPCGWDTPFYCFGKGVILGGLLHARGQKGLIRDGAIV